MPLHQLTSQNIANIKYNAATKPAPSNMRHLMSNQEASTLCFYIISILIGYSVAARSDVTNVTVELNLSFSVGIPRFVDAHMR